MRNLTMLTLVITAGLSAGAFAATEVIHQQGRVSLSFSESVTIKNPARLTFFNHSTASSCRPARGTSIFGVLRLPAPRLTSPSSSFSAEAHVICAIHPRMKMTGESDGLAQNLRHLPPMQATGDF